MLQTTPTTTGSSFVYSSVLVMNMPFPEDSAKQEELKTEINSALTDQYSTVPGFVDITITDLRKGSVVVDYNIRTKQSATESINKQAADLKNGIVIGNTTFTVLSSSAVACKEGCPVTPGDKFYLELGLGVGIPALIIFIALIAICVWFKRRSNFAAQRLNNSDISNLQQAFGSISSIFQRRPIPVNHDFLGTSRFRAWENAEFIQPDFYINNALAGQNTFRIKRPKLI